ncbi:MAG: UDP-3-O-(3-hydroxymyristoyl)glucosamine N-acyltransferase [Gammaproteobacteria bacterium]|nr:UDP-3-O-(3-hydroxymyristoyl)glucosamine N-acyltransferase [Gammaproteobacteria bacterium]MCP5201340.1 UDP-3-O-(3-hydroxymyristoyl)glucosamine N-acyltransferase [Gammaproteobacteria bacterium]
MQITLSQLAARFALEFEGDPALVLAGVCGLSDDAAGHLSFVGADKVLATAAASAIPAFVTRPGKPVAGKANLFHPHPEYLIARIAALFAPSQLGGAAESQPRRHPSAVIADSAEVAVDASIGAFVVIGENVVIGPRARIHPHVVIMDRCRIGADCIVYPNCTLREDSELGARVILQPGVSIGGDGYGYVLHEGRHVKIPQLGRVVLEDDVEVGANSTIDRARFHETRVGRGTKIDNLVMLAHNVVTGEDCLLVSQVGVSGSTRLGNRVVLAGQVGTVGHVTVGDDVTVLGKGGITKDVPQPGVYAGMPLKPARLWRRAMARLYAGLR